MIKFGTDGWRAKIAQDYTLENVEKVIQAYADVLKDQGKSGKIYVGYDCRFLSDQFALSTSEILSGNDFEVFLSSTYCPTPCISWMCKNFDAIGGVMITASHNPFDWNGIKFKESYGGSASPEFCTLVEEKIISNDEDHRSIQSQKDQFSYFDPTKDYVDALKNFIDLDSINNSDLKIGYDALYGSGRNYISDVLSEKRIYPHHHEANPGFGGLNPEPIAKNLASFIDLIKYYDLDVGLVTDGDADRIGAVDENGEFVDSHHIFALILKHLVKSKNKSGLVVKTISTTTMINKQCEKYGLELLETGVGFKHIAKKFLEGNPLMGGEESGGIAIADHVFERDGVLCGLLLLEMMAESQKKLSQLIKELHDEFGTYFFKREDLHLSEEEKKSWIQFLDHENLSEVAGKKIQNHLTIDGHKYIFEDDSWLLIRFSGTEPVMRVYVESNSQDDVDKIMKDFLNFSKNF